MIKFSQIPASLKYPVKLKGQLSTLHSEIVEYAINNFTGVGGFKKNVISTINVISYCIINSESLPVDWDISDPLTISDYIDDVDVRNSLKDLYVEFKQVKWDIEDSTVNNKTVKSNKSSSIANAKPTSKITSPNPNVTLSDTSKVTSNESFLTPKENLYIQSPVVPQFDVNKIWYMNPNNGKCIYTSLPEIPTKQSDISVTTDVSKMSDKELLNLYPNHRISTRSASLYSKMPDMEYIDGVGCILPIKGYTKKQLIDNVIKYPHFFKLLKIVDDKIVSFYTSIEIDGVLYPTLDIWSDLPESSIIPRNSDFIKEYVVRRYLLERDVKKIEHKYKMLGTLDPFLTLFSTPEDYYKWGYKDSLSLAKQCVVSRVSYKQSRNPILREV